MSAVSSNFYYVPQPLVDDDCLICRESLQNGNPLSAHSGERGAKHPMHTQCLRYLFENMDTSVCPVCLEQTNPNPLLSLKGRILRTAKAFITPLAERSWNVLTGATVATAVVGMGFIVGASAGTIAALAGNSTKGIFAAGQVAAAALSTVSGLTEVISSVKLLRGEGHDPRLGCQLLGKAAVIGMIINAVGINKTAVATVMAAYTGLNAVLMQQLISSRLGFLSRATQKSLGGRIVSLATSLAIAATPLWFAGIGESESSAFLVGAVSLGLALVSAINIMEWHQEWKEKQALQLALRQQDNVAPVLAPL